MQTISLIILWLLSVFSLSAQIQRQILGYTLGVSSRPAMIAGLQNKGFILEEITDALNKGPIFYRVKGGVSFGGYIWDDVTIGFVNGKFASIWCETYLTESQSSKLKNALQTKYRRYSTEHTKPSESVYDYNDKRTDAFLWIQKSGMTALSYGDEKLMNASTPTSSSNDL
ncbi:MAG: hypothetical protein J6C81_02345 [Muribaculaceae bacterium]|nr:hypothetical protein [Muribaculaceae bacterium]